MDLAREIAKTVNKEITPELQDVTALDHAVERIIKLYPQLQQTMEGILKESFWEEKRQAVDFYIIPLLTAHKKEEALLLLREIMDQNDSLADIYSSYHSDKK